MAKTLSRSAALARELLGMIARRELQPGDPIDLQALGRHHKVSRTVVREALADLGGKGLVVARPKVGTTVAAASQWNLLDPGFVSVAIAQSGSGSMLGEALEVYYAVVPALAANAARAATRRQQSVILAALRAVADAVGRADREAHTAADQALHEAIADACSNRLLRSIDRALDPVRSLLRNRLHDMPLHHGGAGSGLRRLLSLQSALCLAIARRDEGIAAVRMRDIADLLGSHPAAAARNLPTPPMTAPHAPLTVAPSAAPSVTAPCAAPPAPVVDPAHAAPALLPRSLATEAAPAPAVAAPSRPAVAAPAADEWPDTAMFVPSADLLPLIEQRRRGNLLI